MSKASVSIVTHNNKTDIEERLGVLRSFFENQLISNVYIVDSNSTDDTVKIVKDYAWKFPKINFIDLPVNRGFGYGHNIAIGQSDSRYHLIMNLDSTPTKNEMLDEMINEMDEDSSIGLLSPLVKFPNGETQLLTRNEPTILDLAIRFLGPSFMKKRQEKFINQKTGYDRPQLILNATGSFMFLRMDVLKQINGFDERYFLYMEDTDLTKSVNQISKAWFNPKFVITHEWQRDNHSLRGSIQLVASMIKYFNKWGWKVM